MCMYETIMKLVDFVIFGHLVFQSSILRLREARNNAEKSDTCGQMRIDAPVFSMPRLFARHSQFGVWKVFERCLRFDLTMWPVFKCVQPGTCQMPDAREPVDNQSTTSRPCRAVAAAVLLFCTCHHMSSHVLPDNKISQMKIAWDHAFKLGFAVRILNHFALCGVASLRGPVALEHHQ